MNLHNRSRKKKSPRILCIGMPVRDLIFRPGDGDPALCAAAEGELLLQVQRLRGEPIQSLPLGKRPPRPICVRGLMI